ncbi:MAG: radical SAM protein, partial [Bryobacteraceae bacterium]
RYAMALVVSGRVHDVLDDQRLFNDVLEQTAHVQFDRQNRLDAVIALAKSILSSPRLALRAARWLVRKTWRARFDLVRARGRVNKLSFFIHDFMNACQLEKDRIDACVFAAATAEGPISMCLHNAMRDAFILQPVRLNRAKADRFWNPLSGAETDRPQPAPSGQVFRRKPAKEGTARSLADTPHPNDGRTPK